MGLVRGDVSLFLLSFTLYVLSSLSFTLSYIFRPLHNYFLFSYVWAFLFVHFHLSLIFLMFPCVCFLYFLSVTHFLLRSPAFSCVLLRSLAFFSPFIHSLSFLTQSIILVWD